jgi:hypothetical protein
MVRKALGSRLQALQPQGSRLRLGQATASQVETALGSNRSRADFACPMKAGSSGRCLEAMRLGHQNRNGEEVKSMQFVVTYETKKDGMVGEFELTDRGALEAIDNQVQTQHAFDCAATFMHLEDGQAAIEISPALVAQWVGEEVRAAYLLFCTETSSMSQSAIA